MNRHSVRLMGTLSLFIAVMVASRPASAAPFASGFTFELTGGALFTQVTPPNSPPLPMGEVLDVVIPGFGDVADLLPGEAFDLTPFSTSIFSLEGVGPPFIDLADPTAFPTFLDWTGTATLLTITAIPVRAEAVPEPGTLSLLALGAAAAAVRRRTRQRRAGAPLT